MYEALTALSDLSVLAFEPPGWGAVLLAGLINSMYIAFGGYALGMVIGLLGASGKLYGGVVTRDLLEVYTTVVRAVPELVLILILYYAGTEALNAVLIRIGIGQVDISGLVAGIVVIGVVLGAYLTEVIRGAIKAVPGGEIEAGRSYGMGPFQIFRRIIFPAMLPHALPGLGNYWLTTTKDTALLAVVGFTELTLATRQAAGATKHYMTFFLAAGAIYLTVSILSGIVIKIIEARFGRGLVRPT
ncbi:ABC transporter permease subunit [Rhizobium sp. TH2]|uniref:ABC transporter permease n=1 Tax=Rhizobium sp. TH2 TaxID=2775403 RepID=UPI0021588B77|nr:ABC transporter permease subunit [Rhizobium sp. TH2]UVC08787.1 ABC transporter permease subunit [Rhizobium sp. TH2]